MYTFLCSSHNIHQVLSDVHESERVISEPEDGDLPRHIVAEMKRKLILPNFCPPYHGT